MKDHHMKSNKRARTSPKTTHQKPPTKATPKPPSHLKRHDYLSVLSFPIPSDFHVVSPTKHILGVSCLGKTSKKSFGIEDANLTTYSRVALAYINEIVPNQVFNLGLVSLLSVKHLVITFPSSRRRCQI